MMRQVLFHPRDFFDDIQEPGILKWSQGLSLVFLAYLVRMGILLVGYHFEAREPYQISFFMNSFGFSCLGSLGA